MFNRICHDLTVRWLSLTTGGEGEWGGEKEEEEEGGKNSWIAELVVEAGAVMQQDFTGLDGGQQKEGEGMKWTFIGGFILPVRV